MQLNKQKVMLFMAKQELSIADLAERYGVTKQRMSYILNCSKVRPETAGKLARVLKVDVTEIIKE